MVQAAGFWSYTHTDDADEGGRIRRLADHVSKEYRLITGEEISLFVDRSSLEWGYDWQERIDEALLKTTFFIPIVTPQLFNSEQCRREMLTFTGHARRLGLEQLLLPILYSGPAPREEGATDESMALIARTQWEDWRELRLEDEGSAAHRKGVNRLAQRLADVAEQVSEAHIDLSEGEQGKAEGEEDESPGLLELVAQGEEAMPRWNQTIVDLGRAIEDFGDAASRWTPRLEQMGARGESTSAKLSVLRQVSKDLDEPAARIEELGRQYATDLVTVDPAILSLLSMYEVGAGRHSEENEESAQSMFSSILDMAEASRGGISALRDLIASLEPISRMSRDMRQPIKKANAGLRNVIDGQSVIDEWENRIRALQTERGDERAGDGAADA